jgi:hypothetical protein
MKKNLALGERILRLLVAIVIAVLLMIEFTEAFWPYLFIPLIVLFGISAWTGSCPIYRIFGIDTRQFRESEKH